MSRWEARVFGIASIRPVLQTGPRTRTGACGSGRSTGWRSPAGVPERGARTRRWVHAWGSLLLGLVTWPLAVQAQYDELRLLDGLRQRRLFSVGEQLCRERLANSTNDCRAEVEWTVELMRTYGQRAANTAQAARDQWWEAARETARQFLAQHTNDPLGVLVQMQDALTVLAHGELMRMESEVAPQPDVARDQARTLIREAARAFEQLDQAVSRQMASAPPSAGTDGELASGELFALQTHIRSQLARTYRNQALCYPPGSDDRVAALSLAVEQLQQALQQVQAGEPIALELALDLAGCRRLLGDLAEARRGLAAPLAETAPAEIRWRALAEQMRIEVADHRAQAALDLYEKSAPEPGQAAELDFAVLEAYVALWQRASHANDSAAAEEWQKHVTAAVRSLEQEYGVYWGRRGELLLLSVATGMPSRNNVDLLERTADNLYLKGQLEDAVNTYDKAAGQAREAGQDAAAFELRLKAALIKQQDAQYGAASRRLEQLALDSPQHPKAAATHWQAAQNAAQVARGDPGQLDRYLNLLQTQVARWPDDPTVQSARFWLGRISEGRRDWRAALSAYQQLGPEAPDYAAAVEGAARCWVQWLAEQQAAGRPTAEHAESAVAYLENVIHGPTESWPASWTPTQHTAALAAARILVHFTPDGFAHARELLEQALAAGDDAPPAWQAEARMLRIVALAGQPEGRAEARRQLERLGQESTERLLELVDGLAGVARQAPPVARQELARLLLDALEQLRRQMAELDPHQKLRIARLYAETLISAGRDDQALRAFQQLAADYPDDLAVQIRFAERLLERKERASLLRAADQWRAIARRLRPGTEDWYRAKYSIALAYFQLGDRPAAAQRLQYLQATSQVAESSWAQAVAQLLQRCQ